jgi:hypothetical protein
MKTKVIIKAIFPSLDRCYDIKIPVNEVLWKVCKLLSKAIYDINGINIDVMNSSFVMMNKTTGAIYNLNTTVLDSDIRNGTEIVFFKVG